MAQIERQGAVTVVRPDAPLQAEAIESIAPRLDAELAGGVPLVVVDLTGTPLIDGRGLEWLLDLDDSCGRRGGCVRLCGAGELCRDILRVTGVGKRMQQFDDRTGALASFA
jgi:anti-anti-sigma factor